MSARGRRVLIIVQNLPVPLDRRVWLECQALKARGYDVSVICPKGPGDPSYQHIDGVHIHKYRPAPEAKGVLGFVIEFVYCWIRTALLSLRVQRRHGFDILQACNPPDTYWLLAKLWKLRGVQFVFDHHDLNPELFLSRFGTPTGLGQKIQYRGLRWLERMTFRTADKVISTNESYKRVAVERGHRDPADVTVVRSGPDTRRMRPVYPPADVRRGADHLLVYLGIMGPQDGVEVILHVMRELVLVRGRKGLRAALLGFGDCLESLKADAVALGIDDVVEFTGRADRDKIADYLSAADIGLCPDRRTPLNDLSTMNKTMEYMAYALPAVAFDLKETVVSGGDAAVYVTATEALDYSEVLAFADAVEALLDDADRRVELGVRARRRVAEHLDWRPQATAYVSVFDELSGLPVRETGGARFAEPDPGTDHRGSLYVDLQDEAEVRAFVRTRGTRPAPVPAPLVDPTVLRVRPRVSPESGSPAPLA